MKRATCLNNCSYNCIKQLEKKLSLLWVIDEYIKDAEICGHKECARALKQIKKDEEKHTEMLKKLIKEKVKKGEF
ncbi:MAG TPA: ferritin family protein [Candidatus Nanoarchaeia archaeon]|nr:ferritin family protein [Candidatus Nanoarchaeia archaeon]